MNLPHDAMSVHASDRRRKYASKRIIPGGRLHCAAPISRGVAAVVGLHEFENSAKLPRRTENVKKSKPLKYTGTSAGKFCVLVLPKAFVQTWISTSELFSLAIFARTSALGLPMQSRPSLSN